MGRFASVAPRAATPPVVPNLATVRAGYGRLENQVRTLRPAPRTEPKTARLRSKVLPKKAEARWGRRVRMLPVRTVMTLRKCV